MSILQTLMQEHQQEIEDVKANLEEAEEVSRQLQERHAANISYFKEVCAESIRASNDLFEALMSRERARISRLRHRHKDLMEQGRDREPQVIERILSGDQSRPRLIKGESN